MFEEIHKLNTMLMEADIPHTLNLCHDGFQIRVYADKEKMREFDDCVVHSGSFGHEYNLLETYHLNNCSGYETAEQVFIGWSRIYRKLNQNRG